MKNLLRIGKIEAGVLITIIIISSIVSAGTLNSKIFVKSIETTVKEEWIREVINEQSKAEFYCTSLVFDQYNDPHVFYITKNKELIRSFRTSIGWFHDIIDTDVVSLYVSAKIDANGLMHVCYAKDNLIYIAGDETGWQHKEVVDPELKVTNNCFISLDIDSNNMPHISYYDSNSKDLKYAKKDANIWEVLIIDSKGDVGQYCSIGLDSNDLAHIAYYDETNKDLKYAVVSPYSITTMIADSNNDFGLYSSIAIDKKDQPHIVHSGLKGVKHTFLFASKIFISELIDTDKTQCFTPSIIVDNSNILHVGYSKTVSGGPNLEIDLIYAKKSLGNWELEKAVDGTPFGFFAYGLDINLDKNNNPGISYVDILGFNKPEYVFK